MEKRYRVRKNGEDAGTTVDKEWLSVEHLSDGDGRVYAVGTLSRRYACDRTFHKNFVENRTW